MHAKDVRRGGRVSGDVRGGRGGDDALVRRRRAFELIPFADIILNARPSHRRREKLRASIVLIKYRTAVLPR